MALAVAAQRFEEVAVWEAKVIQRARVVQEQQLAPGHSLNLRWKPPRHLIVEKALGFPAGKAADHSQRTILQSSIAVNFFALLVVT